MFNDELLINVQIIMTYMTTNRGKGTYLGKGSASPLLLAYGHSYGPYGPLPCNHGNPGQLAHGQLAANLGS